MRPGLQVGAPVAGVHVADADEKGRAGEGRDTAARSRPIPAGTGTVPCSPSSERGAASGPFAFAPSEFISFPTAHQPSRLSA